MEKNEKLPQWVSPEWTKTRDKTRKDGIFCPDCGSLEGVFHIHVGEWKTCHVCGNKNRIRVWFERCKEDKKMNDDNYKFRVWDKVQKKFVHNLFLGMDGMLYSYGENLFGGASLVENPENFVIDRCTGLKDKNGKLICDGDIIRLVRDGKLIHTATVMWGDGGGEEAGAWICESTSERNPGERFNKAWYFTSAWEVIDNIHERDLKLFGI